MEKLFFTISILDYNNLYNVQVHVSCKLLIFSFYFPFLHTCNLFACCEVTNQMLSLFSMCAMEKKCFKEHKRLLMVINGY